MRHRFSTRARRRAEPPSSISENLMALADRDGLSRRRAEPPSSVSRTENPFIQIPRGLWGVPRRVFTVLYIVNPARLLWASFPLPDWQRWFGAALASCALLLQIWVHVSLGKGFSSELRVRTDQTLVTTGLYRWVRHPMYSLVMIMMIGWTMLTSNWILAIFGPSSILLLMVMRTPLEEEMLSESYGQAYSEYKRRTGMFFPRLFGVIKHEHRAPSP
jgi:protein-S-isoprenylcysteine O-methyltransferase Ste14